MVNDDLDVEAKEETEEDSFHDNEPEESDIYEDDYEFEAEPFYYEELDDLFLEDETDNNTLGNIISLAGVFFDYKNKSKINELKFQREELKLIKELRKLQSLRKSVEIEKPIHVQPVQSDFENETNIIKGELPQPALLPSFEPENPEIFTDFLDSISTNPTDFVILGRRRAGKSALGWALAEYLYCKTGKALFAYGIPQDKIRFIPQWFQIVDSLDDVENNAILILDEAGISLNARNSLKKENKDFGAMLAISGHKGLTTIVITQTTRQIDVNLLMLSPILVYKEPPALQGFGRKETKLYEDEARKFFGSLEKNERKKHSLFFSEEFGMMVVKNSLASFWSDELSKLYSNSNVTASNNVNSKVEQIKEMKEQGYKQKEIALKLGVSSAYVSQILRKIK